MPIQIRPETFADLDSIRRITTEAFRLAEHASGTEAEIIDRLRAAGGLTLSLVAVEGSDVIGHAAFSPVAVGGQDTGWLGLGPVAVRPDRQRAGTGGALIREGLSRIRAMGAQGCVVLGDPGYYRRFGFAAKAGLWFEGVPPEYFMELPLAGQTPKGAVTYQPPFYET